MPPSPSAAESSERMPGTVEVFVGPGLGEPVTVLPRLNPAVFGFMAGGLAACGAVTFTNPMEVVKTRLQLQGEKLIPSGSTRTGAPRLRLGTLSTLTFLFRSEGLAGLQKGLGTAYLYQLCLNGTRLGLYTPTKDFFTRHLTEATAAGEVPRNRTAVNVLSGMVAGIAGACVGSPLYLIKTRMQSYSTAAGVGHQHHYTGTWGALRRILRQDGVRGLFRGMDASMVRTGVGSA
ncbi:Mitochondrial oxaloacetate carrier protein, partial [Tieghemiomyces parasiticus]